MEENELQDASCTTSSEGAKPLQKKSSLKKRVISGIVYVAILLAFFLVKVLVAPDWFPQLGMLLFDILVLAMSIIGTWEMIRALGDKLLLGQKIVVSIFSAGNIVAYAVSDAIFKYLRMTDPTITNYSPNFAFVVFGAGMAILFSFLVFAYSKVDLASIGYSLFAYLYPSAFLLVLSGINHMPESFSAFSELGILYVFAICPCADTFAFFFGKFFGKKISLKMAPNISPNKTAIGGLGGLLGGAIGAVAIYFVYYAMQGTITIDWMNILFFIGLGILTAAFAAFGDLVESGIKRKLALKDMGKIMPGHGGVLDRIDSTLYASLIVCFVLVMRILILHR